MKHDTRQHRKQNSEAPCDSQKSRTSTERVKRAKEK